MGRCDVSRRITATERQLQDRWGGGVGREYSLREGWGRGHRYSARSCVAESGQRLRSCAASVIMHVAAGLSGSRSCDCAATELYLEILVINEAGCCVVHGGGGAGMINLNELSTVLILTVGGI